MEGVVFAVLCVVAGALASDLWGFIKAVRDIHDKTTAADFDIWITLMTVLPSLAAAIGAGLLMQIQMPDTFTGILIEAFTLISSGFGLAQAQGEAGINNFFRVKKP